MIKIKNYSYSYNSYSECIKNINMSFEKGYMYGIVGKSGSGKTTLFASLTGFLKGKGSIKVGTEFNPEKFTDNISIYFPREYIAEGNTTALAFDETVLRNADKLDKLLDNFDVEVFLKYLRRFKLPNVKFRYSKCSKGQQVLVDLAFTLTYDTDVYLLDEPFNNLDYLLKQEVMKCLNEKVIDGKCVIVSSHNIKLIEDSVDYVYFMKDKTNLDIVDVSCLEDDLTTVYKSIYDKEVDNNVKGI